MMKSDERLKDREGKSMLVKHNLRSSDINGWVKEYMENESYRRHRRSNANYCLHEILSFHKDSSPHLNAKILEDFARIYTNLRADNALVLAVAHHDKDHQHIHLAISGISYRVGLSTRISKAEFAQIKERMQELQLLRYPELGHSIVKHGEKSKKKRVVSTKEYQFSERTGRPSNKQMLADEIQEALSIAKSEKDLKLLLEAEGIETYERNGQLTGVYLGKRKYRFRTLLPKDDITQLIGRKPEKAEEKEPARDQEDRNKSKDADKENAVPEIVDGPSPESDNPDSTPGNEEPEIEERMNQIESIRFKEEERDLGDEQ